MSAANFKPKRTAAASLSFLATARFSCYAVVFEIHAKNSRCTCTEIEFNIKMAIQVVQGHVFSGQWKGDEGLNNTV